MKPFLKLPIAPDVELLKNDLSKCLSLEWPLHFNQKDYKGEWTSISLRSLSGEPTDVLAFASDDYRVYKNTELLETCAYFKEVLDRIECEKEGIRLLRLNAGSEITEHVDQGLSYIEGCFRVHVPIETNEHTWFVIGGESVQMKEGECWYGDFQQPHVVKNEGQTDRIHLVVDCKRNKWSDELFTQSGFDVKQAEESLKPTYSREVIIQMLESFKHFPQEPPKELIEDLEAQL